MPPQVVPCMVTENKFFMQEVSAFLEFKEI